MKDKKCIAILLSGGCGLRMMSDRPKQYIRIKDRLLVTYSLETLLGHSGVSAVQIVAEPEWRKIILADLERNGISRKKLCGFSVPGLTRQLSILNGLHDIRELAETDDVVMIHDAARPNLSVKQISSCLKELENHDGVMPALVMKDTVYLSENGSTVSELLKREKLFAGQAPELFRYGKYYEANVRLMPDELPKVNGSTEPAILSGMDIIMVSGDENNYKITTQADLERFRLSVEKHKESE